MLNQRVTIENGQYTIKGSVHQECIMFINIYAQNIGAPQCVKQTWPDLNGEIDSNTIIVGDFSTLLLAIDHPGRKSVSIHWM